MLSEDEVPRRRHRIVLDIQGDTPRDLIERLTGLIYEIETRPDGLARGPMISGGPTSGSTVVFEHRPEVTHESYFAASDAWRKKT